SDTSRSPWPATGIAEPLSPHHGRVHWPDPMESRMLRNGHVRFGGRPAETHQFKDWQGAAGRPYTYVRTWAGFVYVAFVVDVFAQKIVGWAASRSMTTCFVLAAFEQAVW